MRNGQCAGLLQQIILQIATAQYELLENLATATQTVNLHFLCLFIFLLTGLMNRAGTTINISQVYIHTNWLLALLDLRLISITPHCSAGQEAEQEIESAGG